MIKAFTKPSLFLAFLFISLNSFSQNENGRYIDRVTYKDQLEGFWLGQCIANWTGLVTEMDKIGNIGEIKTGDFYTRKDWGKKDQPNIWGEKKDSISINIDFVLKDTNEVWGADDDTDIEYLYQHLLFSNDTSFLTPQQIADGWLKHIKKEEENYLWVSNQRAFDLMNEGILPPETGNPKNNQFYDMIDAQLTTEIFGLFAPTRPDIAWKMAKLPVQTTARKDAEHIAHFYINMHSLANIVDYEDIKTRIFNCAKVSRHILPDSSYSAKIYDYVLGLYQTGIPWEQTRDSLYNRYQVNQKDGYDITSRNLHCNGCFAAGINFGASLISLFYGEGNLKETIKIGSLCGWDSDNPTATWGGLIGFMIGKVAIEKEFGQKLSNKFNIHRTRQNFPNDGLDTFENMAEVGLKVIDKLVIEELGGHIDEQDNFLFIPKK